MKMMDILNEQAILLENWLEIERYQYHSKNIYNPVEYPLQHFY